MVDFLRDWITRIAALLMVFTATQILLPNNSYKKYIKYTFGLLLTYVLISPVLTFLNKDFNGINISSYNTYFTNNSLKKDDEENVGKIINSSMEIFESNLENLCIDFLKRKYPSNDYEVYVESKYKQGRIEIDTVNIYIFKDGIHTVKKVIISQDNAKDQSYRYGNIINSISEEFNIKSENINVIEG